MKFKKLLLLPLFTLLLTGCTFVTYTEQNNNKDTSGLTSENTSTNKEEYLTDWTYNGTVNYAPSYQPLLTTEENYQQGITSTVYIIADTLNASYLGSGVFFSEDSNPDGYAYIFTNAHLIKDAINVEIIYSNYKRDQATVVGYHALEDIAVLAVKKNSNYTIATLKNSDQLKTASEVLTIGTPISIDYSFSATTGIISKIHSPLTSTLDENYTLLLLQIDATLNSGNSGGPLFDSYGNLIGLNTIKVLYDDSYNEVDDLNFAIPIDRAIFMANRFFNKQSYSRGLLGITISDIVDLSLAQRKNYEITLEHGLYIIEVLETGASFTTLRAGDIITKINNIEFITKNEFQRELFNHSKGDKVNLTVYRNNQYKEITITLK